MADRSGGGRLRKLGPQVLTAIGRQEWLDRPSYRLEHLLSFAYNALGGARDSVTNALNGVWLGHPAHPPLASLTSGALGTTVALDALSLLPGRPANEVLDASRFASRSLALGIAASVGSAVTGVTDWQHTHEEDRRVGLVHGIVNLVATGLYAASWWDRRQGRHGRGIALTALGYGITLAGSYLGGALVFESGVGVDQSGERLRTKEWTPVLPAGSLNGKPVRVEVDGVGLVVCQTKPGAGVRLRRVLPAPGGPDGRRLGRPRPDRVPLARLVVRGRVRRRVARAGGRSAAVLRGSVGRRNGRGAWRRKSGAARRHGRDWTEGSQVNAYDVLKEHHIVIKGLGRKISEAPVNSEERHALFDEMLMELDIHFRIEDDLYYPALGTASKLIAVAHAEHRQVVDQLSVLLRTPQSDPGYEDEWNSFKTVLEAHADEEERDLIPAPPEVKITDVELEELGDKMAARMEQLRGSTLHKLRTKGRAALVRAL